MQEISLRYQLIYSWTVRNLGATADLRPGQFLGYLFCLDNLLVSPVLQDDRDVLFTCSNNSKKKSW